MASSISTIEKNTKIFKTLVSRIKGKTFTTAKEFCEEIGVHQQFFQAVKALGFLEVIGKASGSMYYLPKGMESFEVEPRHGRLITEWLSEQSRKKYVPKVSQNKDLDSKSSQINDFSDEELFIEIRRRGYEGTISKKVSI